MYIILVSTFRNTVLTIQIALNIQIRSKTRNCGLVKSLLFNTKNEQK